MGLTDYLQFVFALAFVLALIGAAAVAAKRFGLTHGRHPVSSRRLAVVESLSLDAKRRLVLIRCDDSEHLLLVGPTSETVITTGIAGIPAMEPRFADAASRSPAITPANVTAPASKGEKH